MAHGGIGPFGLLIGLGLLIANVSTSSAGEFVGLDPYNRAIYAEPGPFPIVPSRITGPDYRAKPGRIGGPLVTGPLYYAEPAPLVGGFYRADPLVASGAILAFDVDEALAQAEGPNRSVSARGGKRPAPFTGEWYRYCEARYRSFDRDSGTFQPSEGARRLCR